MSKHEKLHDCKLCKMGRYVLSEKMSKIMRARGIILVCKICSCPILVGDEVESKQQRRGKTKLYHSKCYDDSHIDIPDTPENMNGEE